jgi:hypothetical protein
VKLDDFLYGKSRLRYGKQILRDMHAETVKAQMIIGGFGPSGAPILMFTDCANISSQMSPGFFCAGAGQTAAMDWLNLREQNARMSIARTYYHLLEAKRFAQINPVVGDHHEIVLLRDGKPAVPVGGDRDIGAQWKRRFWLHPTDCLDMPEAWSDLAKAYAIDGSN